MRTARSKALAAVWIQRGATVVLALLTIPPLALILRAQPNATAAADDRVTLEVIGTIVCVGATAILQTMLRDGCFGVWGFPPMMPVTPRAVFWLRLGTHSFFWSAIVVGTLTILRIIPMYLGLVLGLGLLALWCSVFLGLCLVLGYHQVVAPGLRFWFALDELWMLARLRGRVYPGERSCVAALNDTILPMEQRLMALELIGLHPWVPGGQAALREIAHATGRSAPLAERAREILRSPMEPR